ncbi:hypothetical protein SLNSH_19580 [Alsobacter soli]|uniref:histidine kinase n=1 Tax=Alsobacter soli TaxID=2109933 RepID=A0A2T1HNS2_9HYPH|nr:ATP-binding protein [Alsobacter soli]PSC03261.1 hypothetical protein SLNSH_19580 [Alsobacter soli]
MHWLRARLQGHEGNEHEMTANRVVLLSIVLGYLVVASGVGDLRASQMLELTWKVFAVHYLLTALLFVHLVWRPGPSAGRRLLAIVADLASLSVGLNAGGEASACIFPIYLWVIFGNGFRFGLSYLFAASAVGAALFSGVILTTPFWNAHLPLSIGLLVGLVVLPLYVSKLIRMLSEAKHEAEEASRSKTLFLAGVSHELRTPLNAVIGFSELLDDGSLAPAQVEMVQAVGAAGRTLLGLITRLLDVSRLQSGAALGEPELFALPDLLGSVRGMVFVQAREKGLAFNVSIASDTPLLFVGHAGRLREALVNLCANAVKFTDRGRVLVAVAPSQRATHIRFEVSDTGIGIAADARGRIFERFTQADARIADRYGGTGLGLALVKELVEAAGGVIGVDSEVGQGSCFWFEWPLAEASGPTAVTAKSVVVEAPDALSAGLREALRAGGFPAVAPSPEAGAVALVHAADAGWRARAAELRANFAAMPILLVTPEPTAPLAPEDRALITSTLPENLPKAALAWAMRLVPGLPTPSASANGSLAGLRVLVAEDNRVNQKVVAKMLEGAGARVRLVGDGDAALDQLNQDEFDIVLMDVNMPVMNGVDAARIYTTARGSEPGCPILALTADATSDTARRCREAGMVGCVTKPVNRIDLLKAIRAALDGRSPAAAADTPPAAAPAVDEAARAALRGIGGDAFLAEVTCDFLGIAAEKLDALARADRDQDWTELQSIAHALKSAAGNVGAAEVAALCAACCDAGFELLASSAPPQRRLPGALLRFQHALAGQPGAGAAAACDDGFEEAGRDQLRARS